jgi:hypothetical protein
VYIAPHVQLDHLQHRYFDQATHGRIAALQLLGVFTAAEQETAEAAPRRPSTSTSTLGSKCAYLDPTRGFFSTLLQHRTAP